ncbi:hypothetical protein ES319_D12G129500v1 [Gossypium barbadense]|uniref:Uncharacterized protein n=2 Tax=Gossypium TaxID=3633 RepID=A0A5J5NXV0_GOSBA|nr:hypothetical protein ES319_D12G129500v1 [Gossypium barbadense]TYG40974.1 hypothetical protein ES288_D12G137700v1 [Gossypium darwinii]
MFGSREYPITGVFYSGLKQRYLFISIPFPLHRLPIRCHMNPILLSPNSHIKNTQTTTISCFLRLRHSSPSSKVSWLGTRENRTTSRLEKGMSGPLLAQRVRGR